MLLLNRPASARLTAIPASLGHTLLGPGAAEAILMGGRVLNPGPER